MKNLYRPTDRAGKERVGQMRRNQDIEVLLADLLEWYNLAMVDRKGVVETLQAIGRLFSLALFEPSGEENLDPGVRGKTPVHRQETKKVNRGVTREN